MEPKSRLRAFLAAVADVADDVVYHVEHAFALAWEGAWRTWHRRDPRLYSESRRIGGLTEGISVKPSNKVAVFVIYAPKAVPDFTMTFIAALNRHSYNLIIVSNAELAAATKADLLRHCCLLVERVNIGRDVGGYKDGISIALQRFQNIERLIIANDSIYYLEGGLDRLIVGLDGPQDFIGISEVFEHHYHVASFLLSFGQGVLDGPAFRKFWTDYLPIQTRMWAIIEGEGELTKCLLDAGYRPHILYRAEHLLPKLEALSATGRREALALLPSKLRETVSSLADQASVDGNDVAEAFAGAVVDEVLKRNQMHAAGFAFMKFLNMPVFKRDIVYRELFPLQEVKQIVAAFGEPMRDEIMADLARRAPPSRLSVVRRLLYRHGLI